MGELFRDGASRPVTPGELDMYTKAQALQAQQHVPILQRSAESHSYMFFAVFDGTGQDANDPRQLPTNVGILKAQLDELRKNPDLRIGYKYAEGIGTQHNPLARTWDGAFPYTWDDRIEETYTSLATQTRKWQQQDPEAQIRIAEVGYSRGAVLAPGFARLVDRYGIADPEDLSFGRDAHGHLTVESPRPPLVPPGQVAQAMGLFDPVGTNLPKDYDARLPPSVISAFALLAADERRKAFPHQTIVAPALSADARMLNVPVPGGHSNVGGGNREGGLEALAFNQMADYLNALRDKPLIEHRVLPDDPAQYTVHQARGATALPGLDQDGQRDLRQELANCKIVDPCRSAEPMDQTLAARFEYRSVQPTAHLPTLPPHAALAAEPPPPRGIAPDDPAHPDHALLEQIRRGVRELDARHGRSYDEISERLSRSLLAASKDNRELYPGREHSLSANALERADRVLLGKDGRLAIVVDGDPSDPAHKRAAVAVEQALRTPLEQSDAKLEAANQIIAQERRQAREQARQQEPAQSMHAQATSATGR
ncbi:XVIPCD domain-containing protein [Xanthomonas theicola]|uniref:XVIPCD domain-containing protein n=2 Tax=Xanthomonas theicola TaxID=56464 RepID=UPI00360EDC4E